MLSDVFFKPHTIPPGKGFPGRLMLPKRTSTSLALCWLLPCLMLTCLADQHQAHAAPDQAGTLWGSNTPIPTTEAGIRKARAARRNLQQLLAQKAQLLQQKEEETRKAEAQAHLSARQLARLRQKQARLARQHMLVERHLTKVSAQLDQLSTGNDQLKAEENTILLDEATRLPALQQMNTTPELALLMPPDNPAISPAVPFALLALRHQQNRDAMADNIQRQTHLQREQMRLTDQSRTITAQETRLQTSQNEAESRAEQAAIKSEQAQQTLLKQQALLTQARQSTEALTAIITVLARQEAETRRRLRAQKARFHKLHQRHKEQEVEQQDRSFNPGKGLMRGSARAPVQGRIVTRWAQPTEAGPATGLTYQTAPSAPVTAPCTGRLLFSGAFRSFGPMVILDCGQKQRLVLAGLGTLQLQSGQSVQQGGVIGQMPTRDPLLFVQLRQGTKLMDPAHFF